MNARHARYPFFAAAREAVGQSGVALGELVTTDDPAVSRALERVERALMAGTVESETPGEWSARDELLSYPVARILVSLIDAPAAVRKYAQAEAATAYDRFTDDFQSTDDGLKSTGTSTVELGEFLTEFELTDDVRPESDTQTAGQPRKDDPYRVSLGTYLTLVDPDWGDRWRLVNREVSEGDVRITREELYDLLREAVRRQVAEGLPFVVGDDAIAEALSAEIESLRGLLADRKPVGRIDTVVPDLFPPCMKQLLERAGRGAELDHHSRFALTAFLTGIGMDTDEIVAVYRDSALDEEEIRYQTEYLRDDSGTQYAPPSCATMAAYGDCVNTDERCETITHPLAYYARALDDEGERAGNAAD
ncbi:DNA primase [Haloprofundus marisrubri]|uniref:DNA primase large subunit PriL n=1 Tax=Haloprofundus marisrubri TaxID=1514971 RepID=A0A0W1R449_9EURY|nr:DNA primase large subunit PriL [Haloprofundus marisrubri]KTG08164.1 DNA primase [Haloprofundus marisrubri]